MELIAELEGAKRGSYAGAISRLGRGHPRRRQRGDGDGERAGHVLRRADYG